MLQALSIRDVVLIERLDLTFRSGLGVLTGETGAGKSILLDALGLATGARGDSALVRHGAAQAAVTAAFDLIAGHPVVALLKEQDLLDPEADGESGLVLRRVVTADGRSRAFANDRPISVALLRQLGEGLVEVHGQFDQRGLLNPASHRGVLDAYGLHGAQAEGVATAFRAWRQTSKARLVAEEALRTSRADEDYLRHAVEELSTLDPKPGEEAALAESRAGLMHAEKLVEALNDALSELGVSRSRRGGGGRGIEASLRGAYRALERAAEKAQGRMDSAMAALDRASMEAAEAVGLLERLSTDLDLDPRQAEKVEERLFELRAAARKHHVEVDALPALRDQLAARLATLEDGAGGVARLREAEIQTRKTYEELATALSRARKAAALALDAAVCLELPPLKLDRARFFTRIDPADEAEWGPEGFDKVAFEVATNPGSPPGPIAKIASGGELSRFMLALKVALARVGSIPTLVFDEVDSGIGGAVAAAVGERLARLAAEVQVLVVTHSPQVAARGDHHWHVHKTVTEGRTITHVGELAMGDRREEIARMLAGATITAEARAAAASLMDA